MNRILGIDYRSLTIFRQIVALVYIFFILVLRIIYFEYHSVEHGPFSNEALSSISNPPILLKIIQSDIALISYMLIATIFAIMLFLGIYSSLAALACMLMYIAFARRFFPYYYGTDELMVALLFSLFFVYLIDNKSKTNEYYITINKNPFLLILLTQVTIIYWFNGINKTDSSWFRGEAVSMAAFNILFNKPLGLYFLQFPILNKILTYATHIFEYIFVLLIFLPYKQKLLRTIAAVSVLLFHWGIHFFADVTLYKYTGIAIFFLLMPNIIWNKFPFLNNFLIDKNKRYNININTKYIKSIAIVISLFLLFMAINTSIKKQNDRYQFIKNQTIENINKVIVPVSYNPLRQYWTMFAPSPPKNTGYIAFEYVKDSIQDNINIYGNKMPNKNFAYFHPFHITTIMQYRSFDMNTLTDESQFVLLNLFQYEIKKNITKFPDRREEDYQMVSYRQSYKNFKNNKNKYHFNRTIIASYE